MKGVAPHDRPREKLDRLGPAGLGDNELLAVVLGGGVRGHSALDLANRLMEHAGGLNGFTRLSLNALCRERGVMMGVQQTFGGGARVVFPVLAGWTYEHLGSSYPFWTSAVLVSATLMLSFGIRPVPSSEPTPPPSEPAIAAD